ncbi:ImmA/IrrE family metallo-endopeptidase [Aliidiomarina halalkaliphila]|uniref:ImmA/IrrE family metallo-endopeptidase n=1 Tax=Aliidiomarina halalkaliphila TaxID=2593535 RepID=A0A552X5A7_9GAMM|nr:ImmA/IrrE family metallo-endopeptidase [Aliidiomarina halalkaliphila]TRW50207.1 ImmA/IrrE family metallo-endopeptidase [Aliidiomarina halalkaliphila]
MSIIRAQAAAQKALELAWDKKFPVDPAAIASRLRMKAANGDEHHPIQLIPASREALQGASGSAEFDEKTGFVCKFNESEYPARARFTQAHELGHVLLQHVDESTRMLRDDRFENSNPQETEANAFAAELLMPSKYMPALLRQASSVSSLADTLGVSITALSYRLRNLGLL